MMQETEGKLLEPCPVSATGIRSHAQGEEWFSWEHRRLSTDRARKSESLGPEAGKLGLPMWELADRCSFLIALFAQ